MSRTRPPSRVREPRDFIVVTCEHGGNTIPAAYAGLFRGWHRILPTHRGYDRGAIVMARELAQAFGAPLVTSTISRLLIDLNRSLSNRDVWSDATRDLPVAVQQRIVLRYYAPYRQRVAAIVAEAVRAGRRVIHLSSHSFTPVMDGVVRNADVGLLYDPARKPEKELATHWKNAFADHAPGLRVRRNYPYEGKNDGLTAALRKDFSPSQYVGMEIEINQALVETQPRSWRNTRAAVLATAQSVLRYKDGMSLPARGSDV